MSQKNHPAHSNRIDLEARTSLCGGYMVDGPGFHVWEETHDEALSSASGLAQALGVGQALDLHRDARDAEDPDSV